MEPIPSRWRLWWCVAVLLLLGTCTVAILKGRKPLESSSAPPPHYSSVAPTLVPVEPQKSGINPAEDTAPSPTPALANNTSVQKVFRLVLNGQDCALEAVEEVRGDFRRRRSAPEAHPGTIVSRLLGANGEVLAEEFTHAPDHVCTVLDPNVDGTPTPARLTSEGPHVFQVRFPVELNGKELQIHRITQTEPALATDMLLAMAIHP